MYELRESRDLHDKYLGYCLMDVTVLTGTDDRGFTVKMSLNKNAQNAVIESVRKNSPTKGLVQVLSVTEKQFCNIVNITGQFETDIIASDKRLVII